MRFTFLLSSLLLLFSACGNQPETSAGSVNGAAADSIQTIELSPGLRELVSLFKVHGEFPMVIDSSYLAEITGSDTLRGEQVKLLDHHWLEHDIIRGISYELKSYYEIDSMEAGGTFPEYLENADIGMTVSATVHAGHRLTLEDGTELLTWSLSFSSYPACPYSSGTYVFYSLLFNGKITGSFLAGESYAAGDPPVSMGIEATSLIDKNGKIKFNSLEINSDMDAPESEIVKRDLIISIKEGKATIEDDQLKEYTEPNPDYTEVN